MDGISSNNLLIWQGFRPREEICKYLGFYLSNEAEINHKIFRNLSWAGYLKDWPGPDEGERPSAYIILLADKNSPKTAEYDAGIAAQSILLGAVENQLGGCIIGSVQQKALSKELSLPDELKVMLVLALGKPMEEVVIDDMESDRVKYWRDELDIHHVPKRRLENLIINPA